MSDLTLPRPAAGARLVSVGTYRPRRIVTNAEISTMVDTTDEWIRQRSGIRERRWAGADESLLVMATAAGRQALERAGLTGADVDLLLVTTMTGLSATPTIANLLQAELGTRGGALEANSACAGFTYALGIANDSIRAGSTTTALIVGVERMTDLLDLSDRSTMFLFADGAGAVVVQRSEEPGIGPVVWGSWGEQAAALDTFPTVSDLAAGRSDDRPVLRMQGQTVFRWAVTEMPRICQAALDAAGVKVEQLGAFIPHQANTRILDAMARGLRLPEHVVIADDVRTAGNTSAASIPLAMDALLQEGRAKPGDLALLLGFGGGLSHAAQVVVLPPT